MAFDFNQPAYQSDLRSDRVRDNFQALSTFHKGSTAPASPQEGYSWLDDSDSNNWKLKFYVQSTWVIFAEHMESTSVFGAIDNFEMEEHVEFYEGDVPPPFVDIDNYHFEDAAGFDPSVDQDIVFRLEPHGRYTNGLKLRMKYCMSTAETGLVKFKLDYRLKIVGGSVSGGTDYTTTVTIDPVDSADTVAYNEDISLPTGRLDETIQVAHFRLTRLGTDAGDTHGGVFCLFGLIPKVA